MIASAARALNIGILRKSIMCYYLNKEVNAVLSWP
jgi:hypothetical protein